MNEPQTPKPIANLTGATISVGVAFLLYLLTTTIGGKLALSPISTGLAGRISVVVRSALLAVGTGATMIFGMVGIGLILLTIKQVATPKE